MTEILTTDMHTKIVIMTIVWDALIIYYSQFENHHRLPSSQAAKYNEKCICRILFCRKYIKYVYQLSL